jgi:hypothetical protein
MFKPEKLKFHASHIWSRQLTVKRVMEKQLSLFYYKKSCNYLVDELVNWSISIVNEDFMFGLLEIRKLLTFSGRPISFLHTGNWREVQALNRPITIILKPFTLSMTILSATQRFVNYFVAWQQSLWYKLCNIWKRERLSLIIFQMLHVSFTNAFLICSPNYSYIKT